MLSKSTSAGKLIDAISTYTVNVDEVLKRLDDILENRTDRMAIGTDVARAMRNVGKKPGKEVEVGQPTEPLDNTGYPNS